MSQHVVSLPSEAPIGRAAAVMWTRGANRIPVIDEGGGVVGIVARDDVIEAVARAALAAHRSVQDEVGPAAPLLLRD